MKKGEKKKAVDVTRGKREEKKHRERHKDGMKRNERNNYNQWKLSEMDLLNKLTRTTLVLTRWESLD